MIAGIESGKINTVITKDLSRLGRDYLQTGYYTDMYFPSKRVRYIAISDGIDTSTGYNEMAPFKNLFNDFYARDISKKIRSTLTTKCRRSATGNRLPTAICCCVTRKQRRLSSRCTNCPQRAGGRQQSPTI